MARKKSTEEKEEEVGTVDIFAEAREKRKKAWEAKQSVYKTGEEKTREEFRKFFVKVRGKLNLDKNMEEVIWMHFKTSGFDKQEKFEEGLYHFGYRE